MHDVLPLIAGGLVLFLYAISQLSRAMQAVFKESTKHMLQKFTSNLLSAIIVGTIVTILLDSSSAVIILVIVFVNSELLSLKQAIGLIMGANIGTTFSSQIIALDIGAYAVIPMLIGLFLDVFSKRDDMKKYGRVLIYFGMLFFGLFVIEKSLEPLHHSSLFAEWIEKVESNPVRGALIGGVITVILQSSSGTVGIAIVLAKQNLLSLAGGIAIMLGAEIGTCSDTLLATINGTRQALKAGLFHFIFNVCSLILGLLLFRPFVGLVESISVSDDLGNTIANAHMIFNTLGVVIFMPFVSLFERLLNVLIKDSITDTALI